MGSGGLLSFHLHQLDQNQGGMMKNKDSHGHVAVPKGCMAVMVGEEQKRFVIPVIHIYHPLFMDLLKEAEEEYGFHHPGPITIPCNVQHFSHVQGLIKKDDFFYNHQHHHHYHHHHHHIWCFKA